MSINSTTHPLSASSHLLTLLGDELIGNDRLAVFELVKNSYDADATKVVVEVKLLGPQPSIRVIDNGSGMTQEVITKNWMRLATGSKRDDRKPSPLYKRMPLGEKGVGRLAVQKLGEKIRLVTRSKGGKEYTVEVNWKELIDSSENLAKLSFTLQESDSPSEFPGEQHGTLIEVTGLYRVEWEKRDLRALMRLLTSLKSPFETVSGFDVDFRVPGREEDIANLLDPSDMLNRAVWVYEFNLSEKGVFEWSYEFRPPAAFVSRLRGKLREPVAPEDKHLLGVKLGRENRNFRDTSVREKLHIVEEDLKGIGAIKGKLYVYDRRRESFERGRFQEMRTYLDEQTGIRIYRDGIRVFNYGEPDDDWLLLNATRINRPAARMGTNSVIGAVHLSLKGSSSLKEKTNREGFDENSIYHRFRWIVQSIVNHLDTTRAEDRQSLEKVLKGITLEEKVETKKPFEEIIGEVREVLKKNNLEKGLGKQVDYIEREYMQMRDVLSSSGLAGINLALVFHEIEREVVALRRAIENVEGYDSLRTRAGHVVGLLDAVGGLLKQSQKRSVNIKQLLQRIFSLNKRRFEHHKIIFSCPVLTGEDKDFEIQGPVNLFLAAINNLVDNAIYWSRVRAELEPEGGRTFRFRGLAVPGYPGISGTEDLVAVWKTSGSERFQNYRAIFTVLDEAIISQKWVKAIGDGQPCDELAPLRWTQWVSKGSYTPLIAPRTQQIRSKNEQLPQSAQDQELIRVVRARYSSDPFGFEWCAAEIVKLMLPNVSRLDLTRPYRDGGRDGIGAILLGHGHASLEVLFALEAKCYGHQNSVGVRELSRLISRIKHREFGVLVTTSYVHDQAYREVVDDGHPVILITANDICGLLKRAGYSSPELVMRWLVSVDACRTS